jgi:hypothetical protein
MVQFRYMEFVTIILLLAIIYFAYYMGKKYKAVSQSTITGLAYAQLLYILMEEHNFKEADYHTLVAKMWDVDSDLLDYREFNKKWEKIATALNLVVHYEDGTGITISEKLPGQIATKIYHNRHLFQQYNEAAKRQRKSTEAIMNDHKYDL